MLHLSAIRAFVIVQAKMKGCNKRFVGFDMKLLVAFAAFEAVACEVSRHT
jgi:hypothetical protein